MKLELWREGEIGTRTGAGEELGRGWPGGERGWIKVEVGSPPLGSPWDSACWE